MGSPMCNFPSANPIVYKLIIIEPMARKILCDRSTASLRLPVEQIDKADRCARALVESVKQKYFLQTVQLAILAGSDRDDPCAIHEVTTPRSTAPKGHGFFACSDISETDLSVEQRSTLLKIL